MTKSHNKKRNAGLLYEFLVRSIAQALIDGDKRRSAIALKLIKRHFRPGTQLCKEMRLVNSLIQTTVSSEAIAASILREARAAARSHDVKALDREKSLLISCINRSLGDVDFYDQPVKEYKAYATVQTLINDWRSPGCDIGRTAQYEDQVLRRLVSEKADDTDTVVSDDEPGTSRLLVKVMMRRLNEKYSGTLSNGQQRLLRAYALSASDDDRKLFGLRLAEIRDRLCREIDSYRVQSEGVDAVMDNKLQETRRLLDAEDLTCVDDAAVTRFMLYTKLSDELTSEEP